MINAARRPLANFLSKQTLTAASPRIAAQATATASFGWFGLGLRFNGTTAAQPVDEQIKDLIASNKVFIFSKTFCGRTKSLLDSLEIPYSTIELDEQKNESEIQKELFKLTHQSTVPNIFISGRHVGGNSDLQALHQKGELLDLVSGGDAAAPEVKAKL